MIRPRDFGVNHWQTQMEKYVDPMFCRVSYWTWFPFLSPRKTPRCLKFTRKHIWDVSSTFWILWQTTKKWFNVMYYFLGVTLHHYPKSVEHDQSGSMYFFFAMFRWGKGYFWDGRPKHQLIIYIPGKPQSYSCGALGGNGQSNITAAKSHLFNMLLPKRTQTCVATLKEMGPDYDTW